MTVAEMPARDRLAMDLDTPLDLALLALMPGIPRTLRELAAIEDLRVPRLAEIRAVAADRQAELLIFGRTSSRGLTWLERHTACRIRFLSEERGLRTAPVDQRPSRASLGRLIDARGPEALASIVAELADGAILDSRVLLADRFGRDERGWPRAGGSLRLGPAALRRYRGSVAPGADRGSRRRPRADPPGWPHAGRSGTPGHAGPRARR